MVEQGNTDRPHPGMVEKAGKPENLMRSSHNIGGPTHPLQLAEFVPNGGNAFRIHKRGCGAKVALIGGQATPRREAERIVEAIYNRVVMPGGAVETVRHFSSLEKNLKAHRQTVRIHVRSLEIQFIKVWTSPPRHVPVPPGNFQREKKIARIYDFAIAGVTIGNGPSLNLGRKSSNNGEAVTFHWLVVVILLAKRHETGIDDDRISNGYNNGLSCVHE